MTVYQEWIWKWKTIAKTKPSKNVSENAPFPQERPAPLFSTILKPKTLPFYIFIPPLLPVPPIGHWVSSIGVIPLNHTGRFETMHSACTVMLYEWSSSWSRSHYDLSCVTYIHLRETLWCVMWMGECVCVCVPQHVARCRFVSPLSILSTWPRDIA